MILDKIIFNISAFANSGSKFNKNNKNKSSNSGNLTFNTSLSPGAFF
jgi:hypothetical protein